MWGQFPKRPVKNNFLFGRLAKLISFHVKRLEFCHYSSIYAEYIFALGEKVTEEIIDLDCQLGWLHSAVWSNIRLSLVQNPLQDLDEQKNAFNDTFVWGFLDALW